MEVLPIVSDNYFSEREGVLKIALELNHYGFVFRETPNGDVGIDGQIEFVNIEKQALGKTVAVQIKSGDSYIIDKGDHWAFYAKDKHKFYWESYPLPVILLVYSPSNEKTYFVDARFQLNIPQNHKKYISIPKENILTEENKELIFESVGSLNSPFMDIDSVFREMINQKCSNPDFSVSYFDLFINGMTNLCRQLFFSMSLACEIAEYNNNTEFVSIGFFEQEFLHNYVKFLVSQNLARVDYADYLIDWKVRLLQPEFLAPITGRGRKLMEYISEKEKYYMNELSGVNLICERSLRMVYLQSDYQRLEKIKKFIKIMDVKDNQITKD